MTFKPAVRENLPLLIGIAGPSGGGKTYSAMRLASGIAGDKPFAFIDTENGRALHYADRFQFLHDTLEPPFTPSRYADKIDEAVALDVPVIVIDSGSHEHVGEGGVLDMHESELQRLTNGDGSRRGAFNQAAWIKPKEERKRFIQKLTRVRPHVIVCLRAEDKVDIVKNEQTGRTEIKPKRTLSGHVGWIPVAGKELAYEFALSVVVTPDNPGVPVPVKLPEDFKPMVPLDQPLSEDVGRALAEWAAGTETVDSPNGQSGLQVSETRLLELAELLGKRDTVEAAIADSHGKRDNMKHAQWLRRQITEAEKKLAGSGPASPPRESDGAKDGSASDAAADGVLTGQSAVETSDSPAPETSPLFEIPESARMEDQG